MNIGYKLEDTREKGEGIFATRRFVRGNIVMAGAIEKDNLMKNHSHASQMGEFRYALHGGLVNKVNHSCSPNCGIKLNNSGAHDFVAMENVEVGDEITFDYAMRNYSIEFFPLECCCGAANCRGDITGWKNLPDSFKLKYAGFIAPYLLNLNHDTE